MNTQLDSSMGDLYRETQRITATMRQAGYRVTLMWECDWDR